MIGRMIELILSNIFGLDYQDIGKKVRAGNLHLRGRLITVDLLVLTSSVLLILKHYLLFYKNKLP